MVTALTAGATVADNDAENFRMSATMENLLFTAFFVYVDIDS
jgi:hypothetical protein